MSGEAPPIVSHRSVTPFGLNGALAAHFGFQAFALQRGRLKLQFCPRDI